MKTRFEELHGKCQQRTDSAELNHCKQSPKTWNPFLRKTRNFYLKSIGKPRENIPVIYSAVKEEISLDRH